MDRALDFQRLILVGMLVTPVSLVGILLQPFIIATMLTPPKGYVPPGIVSPKTPRDQINRTYYYLRFRRTPEDLAKALESANQAVGQDPNNGDSYVSRAYVRHAMVDRQAALQDLDTALRLYEAAGNELEIRNTHSIYIPQIRDTPSR